MIRIKVSLSFIIVLWYFTYGLGILSTDPTTTKRNVLRESGGISRETDIKVREGKGFIWDYTIDI